MNNPIHEVIENFLQTAKPIHTEKWQGVDIKDRPEAEMMEQLFVKLHMSIPSNIYLLKNLCRPNLPWADDHFELERVSGQPINPGKTWEYWPWASSANKFRDKGEQFNHSYAERYWPKLANQTQGGRLDENMNGDLDPMQGIREPYGDLDDVVSLLKREPHTRQAYLPIFFPEDTGAVHGGRIPCSLGYHFIQRDGFLHVSYQLRSCDIYRHMRDDIYLTSRLLLWVLDKVREEHSWMIPGSLDMQIASLHCFISDYELINKNENNLK